MSTITIKKIDAIEQLPACAELLVEAYNAPPWNDNWGTDKALEKLECFYNSPKFLGWMALSEGRLLGCCVGNIEPYYTGDYFYLKEMFVSVQAQRSGVGTELMANLKKHLETAGINAVILFTGKGLFPFNFYLKAGFSEMDGMRMMHFGEEA
jgi:GNAT superfamily N-acetyltransferase